MSIFDDWARYLSTVLSSESALAGSILTHPTEKGNAREALIRQVLSRFLPALYEIGTGEIVDHLGGRSRQMDIVVARRDFPSLSLPSGSKVYLVESVLATIEVKSQLNSQTLPQALENIASVADLKPTVVAGTMDRLATERGLRKVAEGSWVHDDPIETARFDLLARPPGYIYGFAGYTESVGDFAEAVSAWATPRKDLALRHYPAVVAASKCFGWRNALPYGVPGDACLLISSEDTPLRLLVLHLLYSLSRKIPAAPDINGIVPNLDVYLQQMAIPPKPTIVIGRVFNKS